MKMRQMAMVAAGVGLALGVAWAGVGDAGEAKTFSFARGKWDEKAWVAVRQPNQTKPVVFVQGDESIGVSKKDFDVEDYRKERDNAILVMDTGMDEAQVEVTFKAGEGFNKSSTPGIVVSPEVKDGVMTRGIGVFVAPYGFVAWAYTPGDEARPVRYQFAAQVNKAFDLEKKHVIKCRFSKAKKSVAVQVDDSDVMVMKFLGHPTIGTIPVEVNSKVGVWGCHGVSDFYEMKVIPKGTLAFDWPEKK